MNNKRFVKLIILNLFTSGHCIVGQMSLSMALSYIFSNSILVFSFFSGLYLMAMGMGVLLIERFNFKTERWMKLILLNSLLGVLLANPGITGILLFNEFIYYILRTYQLDLLFIMFPIGMLFTIMIGIVSGAELPIFSKLIEKKKWHISKPLIGVLTSDYIGAFVGISIFAFILYPLTGLLNAIFVSQIITLICINYMYFSIDVFKKRLKACVALNMLNLYVIFMYVYKDEFVMFIDAVSGH